ncbi:MAG: HesA/MoeB/ThiF family protein [Burkholderiales bacterium]|nr:HesA/MoeB/ThiF family protein [Flavobacterium sp.]
MTMLSKRYEKQIALPEIGLLGQQKLASAKVLVIGAGGLGCPVLQNLVAAGIGFIGIVDGDAIEETNLHRQWLYRASDCGKNKAVVAAGIVSKQNPEVQVIPYPNDFNRTNAFAMVADYQILVDCTDNIETRYLINDIALVKKIPMVYASVHKFQGQMSVLHYKNGPSYRCLFPEKEASLPQLDCNDSGILGILPNTLGLLQATEVLKIILGIGTVLNGKLLLYDGLKHHFQTINFNKNKAEIEKGMQRGLSILNHSTSTTIGISATTFLNNMLNDDQLVIDIREEYEEPKLEFACIQCVPLSQLDDFLAKTPKNQKIILMCQHGNRSETAAHYILNHGFTQVYHLEKGIDALEKLIPKI